MDIIFVGSIVEMNMLYKFPNASVAGNKMQVGILEGLYELNNQLQACSFLPRRMFVKVGVDQVINKLENINFEGKFPCKNIPYINIILLKQITIFISILYSLFVWALKKENSKKVILTYNTLSYTIIPVLLISKLFKIKSVGIIADLPIKEKKNIFQKTEDWLEIKTIGKLDAIIPLTENIATDFAPNTPYLVIEAGQSYTKKTKVSYREYCDASKINVVFSGTLNVLSGIELVLSVFSELSNEYILHIYGKGDREKIILKYCKNHQNIVYHGVVSNEKMLQIQEESNILVCPRYPDDFTTKYTFPSKILEYMTSGVPIICNRLTGIPREYDDYINIIEECTVDAWCKMIVTISNDTEKTYIERAINAKKFVENTKSWKKQCSRIFDFIGEV